jgi:hypothetical protein
VYSIRTISFDDEKMKITVRSGFGERNDGCSSQPVEYILVNFTLADNPQLAKEGKAHLTILAGSGYTDSNFGNPSSFTDPTECLNVGSIEGYFEISYTEEDKDKVPIRMNMVHYIPNPGYDSNAVEGPNSRKFLIRSDHEFVKRP